MAVLFTWLRNFSTSDPIPSSQIKYSANSADLYSVKDKIDENTSAISALPSLSDIKDAIYPVGSIYLSVTNTDPGTLFGGTWEQLKDRFLLGAGDTYTAGNTGGASAVALTTEQIPAHTHTTSASGKATNITTGSGYTVAVANDYGTNVAYYTGSTGSGATHNNMPPYLVVYCWKRTA